MRVVTDSRSVTEFLEPSYVVVGERNAVGKRHGGRMSRSLHVRGRKLAF